MEIWNPTEIWTNYTYSDCSTATGSTYRLTVFASRTWDTKLYDRSQFSKSKACSQINLLQDRMRRAKGSSDKNKVALDMLRLEDYVRGTR
jgi:hypothetical protein